MQGYRIYTKEELESIAAESDNTFLFVFEFGRLSFALVYTREYFKERDHAAFYAMSNGFDSYTPTGYKSMFFNAFAGCVEEAKRLLGDLVAKNIESSGIDLHNREPVQLSLF